jgi:hypothetical protein
MFLDPPDYAAGFPDIAGEVDAEVRAYRGPFLPYPKDARSLSYTGSWDALPLFATRPLPPVESFPSIRTLLGGIPGLFAAALSVIGPHAHVRPHRDLYPGWSPVRLHLSVRVEGDCELRVGNESRALQAGGVLLFEPSMEHELVNRSDEARVAVLIDLVPEGLDPASVTVPNLWRTGIDWAENAFPKLAYCP